MVQCLAQEHFSRDGQQHTYSKYELYDINKPEKIRSPDDGQVPGMHVGLGGEGGHFYKVAHQKLQSPEGNKETGVSEISASAQSVKKHKSKSVGKIKWSLN